MPRLSRCCIGDRYSLCLTGWELLGHSSGAYFFRLLTTSTGVLKYRTLVLKVDNASLRIDRLFRHYCFVDDLRSIWRFFAEGKRDGPRCLGDSI